MSATDTQKFAMTRDINGYNSFGLPVCPDNYNVVLAQNVAQSFTVPATYTKWMAVFAMQPGANVFVSNSASPAEVSNNFFAKSASQYLPASREVAGGSTISVITPDTSAIVGVSLYAIS